MRHFRVRENINTQNIHLLVELRLQWHKSHTIWQKRHCSAKKCTCQIVIRRQREIIFVQELVTNFAQVKNSYNTIVVANKSYYLFTFPNINTFVTSDEINWPIKTKTYKKNLKLKKEFTHLKAVFKRVDRFRIYNVIWLIAPYKKYSI